MGKIRNAWGMDVLLHMAFEEITFQSDSPMHIVSGKGNNRASSSHHNGFHHIDIWDQHESHECSSLGSGESRSFEGQDNLDEENSAYNAKEIRIHKDISPNARDFVGSFSGSHSLATTPSYHYDVSSSEHKNEIQQELRWLRTKSQIKLTERNDKELGRENGTRILSHATHIKPSGDHKNASSYSNHHIQESCPYSVSQRARKCEVSKQTAMVKNKDSLKNVYNGSLLPNTLHRTTSLPVDAVYYYDIIGWL